MRHSSYQRMSMLHDMNIPCKGEWWTVRGGRRALRRLIRLVASPRALELLRLYELLGAADGRLIVESMLDILDVCAQMAVWRVLMHRCNCVLACITFNQCYGG